MFTTASMADVLRLVGAEHSDPHTVLGMREVVSGGCKRLSARAFIPDAAAVSIDDGNGFVRELERVHDDGFFETLIDDRDGLFRYTLKVTNYDGATWEARDPYSFAPVLTPFDLQLFGEGTHYEIYNKFGARLTEIDGAAGALFAVWAPAAKRVSVIGSFNRWDGRRHQMRELSGSGVWELFIPGLTEGDSYKFEILARDGRVMEKTDPYGSSFETRPGTGARIADLRYEWNDGEWEANKTMSAKDGLNLNVPMSVYEVHLGSWRRNDGNGFLSYNEIADQLVEYVKDMGYTHVEFLPVMEHPFDGSWGYQTTGYFAPTSRFGKPSDFMRLIDKLHQAGIAVILDWTPAHFANDDYALSRFDGSAVYEHEDPRRASHPQWGTLIFNYGRKQVKNFLIASALFWLDKFHADGIRVDGVSSMLYLDYGRESGEWSPNRYGGKENLEAIEFLKHLNSIISKRFPGRLVVAEESTSWADVSRPTEKGGLGFTHKWNMGWMNDHLSYIAKEPIYRRYHHNNLTFGMIYAYTENFVLPFSHDEVVHGKRSLLAKMPGDDWQKFANLRLSIGFMFGHPGKKLLFMGGEFGQKLEWNENKALDWELLDEAEHKGVQSFVRDLNHLYAAEPAFWSHDYKPAGFEWIECNDAAKSVVSFMRFGESEEDALVFVCNFTPVPQIGHRIGVKFNKDYREVMNSDDLRYGGSGVVNRGAVKPSLEVQDGRPLCLTVNVPPLGVVILK